MEISSNRVANYKSRPNELLLQGGRSVFNALPSPNVINSYLLVTKKHAKHRIIASWVNPCVFKRSMCLVNNDPNKNGYHSKQEKVDS